MAQLELNDVVVTKAEQGKKAKLAVKVGSRTISLATFESGEDADAFEEILTEAQKRLGSVPD